MELVSFRRKKVLRIISIVLLQTFLCYNIGLATVERPQIPPEKDQPTEKISIEDIGISKNIGSIKSKHKGKGEKLVIHIQDAHCNFEAQENIAKILDNLIKNYNVNFVAVEGADGIVDTSWFRAFPDPEIRREVARYFMKKGEITGVEFLSITNDYPFTLYGAEDKKYYIKNLNSFLESYPYKNEFKRYYKDIKGILAKLKRFIYTKELLQLDKKINQHKEKEIKFADYARYLNDIARSKNIKIKKYENFKILIETLHYEKDIDFDVVNDERARLIDELSKEVSKDKLAVLVSKSIAFKLGKIEGNEFYAHLAKLAKENNISLLEKYNNLARYIIYSRIYSRINNEKLFEEIDVLIKTLKEKMFINNEQRTLDKLWTNINVILSFMDIELTNKEYEYYLANSDEFESDKFMNFIEKASSRFGLAYNISEPPPELNYVFPKLVDFYEIATKRDELIVENMFKGMRGKKTNVAVLITGGFHTKGISTLLEKEDVSYVVISPSITKETESPYMSVLTGQKTPFEELLAETAKTGEELSVPYLCDHDILSGILKLPMTSKARALINDILRRRQMSREEYAALFVHAYILGSHDSGPGLQESMLREFDRVCKGYRIDQNARFVRQCLANEASFTRIYKTVQARLGNLPHVIYRRLAGKQLTPQTRFEAVREILLEHAPLLALRLESLRSSGKVDVAALDAVERTILESAFSRISRQRTRTVLPAAAIRLKGGELTPVEHGTRGASASAVRDEASVIGAIADRILSGNAYAILKEGNILTDDVDIDMPASVSGVNQARLDELRTRLQGRGINFIVIKGLKTELKRRGVASDLILHPGIRRHSVYLDEEDFLYLLSLPNGVNLIVEANNHEKTHIDHADFDEATVEDVAPSHRVKIALITHALSILQGHADTARTRADWQAVVDEFLEVSESCNALAESATDAFTAKERKALDELVIEKSILARDTAARLMAFGDASLLSQLTQRADGMMVTFLEGQVARGKTKPEKAQSTLATTRKYLGEWLDPANNIPPHLIQGIYRAMLEGRSADILYSFGSGWREFGTAGIRNPALQSSFPVIQEQELKEFAESPFAPILTGPNLINAVTLLQQETAVVRIMRELHGKIRKKDPSVATLDPEFKKRIMNNRVTMAYDSRINGEYFAELLTAAFLRDGIEVDLFDNAAGVPHLAWAANREGAVFGFLISASHSEANYNGFKVFLGHQMSQVDKETKEMIMSARNQVGYDSMNLDLAVKGAAIEGVLKSRGSLRWIGSDAKRPGKKYHSRPLVSFYPWYYRLIKERSPLALLDEETRKAVEDDKRKNPLEVLYTAFFGVGAEDAADFRGFLRDEAGYSEVDIVEAQTARMNGMFPGHKMPDPGIVQGWVANLLDFIRERAGADLVNIESAINQLNEKEIGLATDPDIDRAGIMVSVPNDARGNVKEALIAAVTKYIRDADPTVIPEAEKERRIAEVAAAMKERLNDKLLLTANDAWTFMMYWKLKMMEENGKLEKDRVYIIEKSHVTTSALRRVAQLYRDKGYHVYVVDTYVGFTEIGKKGRDLFRIAKLSWDIHRVLETARQGVLADGEKAKLHSLMESYRAAYAEFKEHVPYQTAGLPIIDETISLLDNILTQQDARAVPQAMARLNALSRMHILSGVEESNGYGELGRWNRDTETVELNHISDKDGSLAAFEFLELVSYGGVKGKTGYDMYKDLITDIGMVCTVNSALYHPGLTGIEEKLNEMEAFEKLFAYVIQKRLDRGEEVKLFNGRYIVNKVEIYRDEKYDNNFLGFTEEGVRLYLTAVETGSEIIITYRPSGTGDSNRDYNWLLGVKPRPGTDFEEYRRAIEDEMEIVVRDFFGVEGQLSGYADLSPTEFHGLLIALKEGGFNRQSEILGKALTEGPLTFTDTEQELYEAVSAYALAARRGNDDEATINQRRTRQRAAWKAYLESPEVASIPNKLTFSVNGEVVAEVPRAAAMAWQAGLVDYLVGLAEDSGVDTFNISFNDQEIIDLIGRRMPLPTGFSPDEWQWEVEGNIISAIINKKDSAVRAIKINGQWVVQSTDTPSAPGAVTESGRGITQTEHRKVINVKIKEAMEAKERLEKEFDRIPLAERGILLLKAARHIETTADGIELFEIPGLEELSYLVAHPGRGGEVLHHKARRIYLSPTRAEWYRGLRHELKIEFLDHEREHLKNPEAPEHVIKGRAPITNILAEIRKEMLQRIHKAEANPAMHAPIPQEAEGVEATFLGVVDGRALVRYTIPYGMVTAYDSLMGGTGTLLVKGQGSDEALEVVYANGRSTLVKPGKLMALHDEETSEGPYIMRSLANPVVAYVEYMPGEGEANVIAGFEAMADSETQNRLAEIRQNMEKPVTKRIHKPIMLHVPQTMYARNGFIEEKGVLEGISGGAVQMSSPYVPTVDGLAKESKNLDPSYTHVFIIYGDLLEGIKGNAELATRLQGVLTQKILPIARPSVTNEHKGIAFVREIESAAVKLGLTSKKEIEEGIGYAIGLQRIISQLRGGVEVTLDSLRALIGVETDDLRAITNRITTLLNKLLIEKPIEQYDMDRAVRARRELLWSL